MSLTYTDACALGRKLINAIWRRLFRIQRLILRGCAQRSFAEPLIYSAENAILWF